ncbi:hypothetical protein [Lactococcus garvieae]|uniref:hypothetical protein n=1 Tax=Lactococcus garvieae TaxID=1363 RepID=UPI001A8F9F00|nr:hypothetical protein [Lactococcus garvieae]QSQ99684.1 hypothetical protein J0J34_06240 [Lactococcus garvieae]
MDNIPTAADVTTVNPSGTPQAFALSFTDVVRLSTPEGPFSTPRLRDTRSSHWWTRTNSGLTHEFYILRINGILHPHQGVAFTSGVRPAIIIHQ